VVQFPAGPASRHILGPTESSEGIAVVKDGM
jgi:hypothetical protein